MSFHHFKGILKNILDRFGLSKLKFTSKETKLEYFDYGLCYEVNNRELVNFGKIETAIQKQFDVNQEVFYAQINYDVFI